MSYKYEHFVCFRNVPQPHHCVGGESLSHHCYGETARLFCQRLGCSLPHSNPHPCVSRPWQWGAGERNVLFLSAWPSAVLDDVSAAPLSFGARAALVASRCLGLGTHTGSLLGSSSGKQMGEWVGVEGTKMLIGSRAPLSPLFALGPGCGWRRVSAVRWVKGGSDWLRSGQPWEQGGRCVPPRGFRTWLQVDVTE